MNRSFKIVHLLSIITILILLSGCVKHYNEWVEKDGKQYYYNDKGFIQTGWIQDQGNWYYLDPKRGGEMLKDQWVGHYLLSPDSYYVDESGKMLTNTTREIDGITFIFDNDGKPKLKPDKPNYELIIDSTFPKTFRAYKNHWTDVIIENVTYSVGVTGDDIYFQVYYTGMAGNTADGPNHSFYRKVGWKLYDPTGYAVGSGVFRTDAALKQGEKFKDNHLSDINYCILKEKGVYRLELSNVE